MKSNKFSGLSRYAVCMLLIFASLSGAQEREWGVNREIVQVSESVYRWGSDNQYGAYIVGREEFSDYRGHDRWLDQNVVTMWEYLYRYCEPNQRITEDEAVACREDVNDCRTSDPVESM